MLLTVLLITINTLTANELKTKGISALASRLEADEEVVISVRGQNKYVVIGLEKHEKCREYELEATLQRAKNEVNSGDYIAESVDEHMKRLNDAL